MMSELWRMVHIVQEVGFLQNQPYLRIAAFFLWVFWPMAPPRKSRPTFRPERVRPGRGQSGFLGFS